MTHDATRERFEKWVTHEWAERETLDKSGDEYKYSAINYAWQGWQAATAETREEYARIAEPLVAELKAARNAWHESFGVPVSLEHARFMDAIGNLTDWAERIRTGAK